MDRIIKTIIKGYDIVKEQKIKTNNKIKNLVKNFKFIKDKNKDKISNSQIIDIDKKQDKFQQKQQNNNRFAILSENLRKNSSIYPLIHYQKHQIKLLMLSTKTNQKIAEQIIFQKVDGNLGILQLGEGGFINSNQSHIILVISINNKIHYFRQIHVQNLIQFIQISIITHQYKIFYGKFISNNLLIFLTEEGIQIGNVNSKLQLLHRINYDAFSYIDFFNQEESFNFDKKILYGNILKIKKNGNQNCMICCLQGKRIINGIIFDWKNYLNMMIQQFQWDKCMKCALMIYQGKITLLGSIPQRLEQRNQRMRTMFEKVALTYLSYELKNNQNEKKQYSIIIHNVIDFLVKTQTFIYLFTTIYQACKSLSYHQIFIEELEQYVEHGLIKWITKQVLYHVIEHYQKTKPKRKRKTSKTYTEPIQKNPKSNDQQPLLNEQQKPKIQKTQQPLKTQQFPPQSTTETLGQMSEVLQNREHLQTMMMNLDLNQMQKQLILTICLNHQLYQSLIHVCKQQGDYATPIIKLCGLRLVKLQDYLRMKQQMNQLKNTQQQDINIDKINGLKRQLIDISNLIFYYLSQCLLGHMTQFSNVKKYLQMLDQILKFIFTPSSFMMLLQISIQKTFNILGMVFSAQVMQYLLENQDVVEIGKFQFQQQYSYKNKLDRNNLQKIMGYQLTICRYRYTEIPKIFSIDSNTRGQNNQQSQCFHSVFSAGYHQYIIYQENGLQNNQQKLQEFSIYNKLLSIVVFTLMNNYTNHHKNEEDDDRKYRVIDKQIIKKISSQCIDKCQSNGQYLYTLSDEQLSQLYLFNCHKFILYLILTNSFPIRLSWKVLAYECVLVYPLSFLQDDNNKNNLQIIRIINSIAIRAIDSIIRENSIMITALCNNNYLVCQEIQKYRNKVLETLLQELLDICNMKLQLQNQQQINEKTNKTVIDNRQLFIPTKCYLLYLLNNQNGIIKTILSSKKKQVKMQVFSFFIHKINFPFHNICWFEEIKKNNIQNFNRDMIDISLTNPIIQQFLINLSQLISLSKLHTLIILISISEALIINNLINYSKIIVFLKYFQSQPQLHFIFIENLLYAYQRLFNYGSIMKEESHVAINQIASSRQKLALMHLQSVVKYKKQLLHEYVLKINYPLEQAFKVCEQCQNKTAMAYILIKGGRNMQGVMLISDIFIASSKQVFRDLAKSQETLATKQHLQQMNKQLNKIIQTCTNEYINDIQKGEQMWQKVSQKLFKQLNIKSVDNIPINRIKQTLCSYFDRIIKQLFNQVNTQYFIQKFSNKIKIISIPTRYYVKAYDLIFQKLLFSYDINMFTKQLERKYQIKLAKNIQKIHMKASSIQVGEEICEKCKEKFNKEWCINVVENMSEINDEKKDKMLIFNCRHVYHYRCFEQAIDEIFNVNKLKSDSSTSHKIDKKVMFICPSCKRKDYQKHIYGEYKNDAQRFCQKAKQKKKQVHDIKKNRLHQFDQSCKNIQQKLWKNT